MIMWLRIGLAAAFVAIIGLWQVQVARLRADLAECRNQQLEANAAVVKARDDGREEGRIAANADGERLRAEALERQAMLETTITDLRAITARLNAPRPPVRVEVDPAIPVVVTPPAAMSCALDRKALDEMQAFLNRGRK